MPPHLPQLTPSQLSYLYIIRINPSSLARLLTGSDVVTYRCCSMSLFTFSVICNLDDVSFESILKPIIPACQFESLNYTRLSISTTQGSQPFLSNFSWFSWLFFAIFMVFMVIFSLKFITWFSCFFGHNLMSFYSKLNFDVVKFLL